MAALVAPSIVLLRDAARLAKPVWGRLPWPLLQMDVGLLPGADGAVARAQVTIRITDRSVTAATLTELRGARPRVGCVMCRPKGAAPSAATLLFDVSFTAPTPAHSATLHASEWALPQALAPGDEIVTVIEYDWITPGPSRELLAAIGPLVQLEVSSDPLHADVAALAGEVGQCTWPLAHLVRALMAATEANRVCTMRDAEFMNRPPRVTPPPPSALAAFLMPLRQVRRVPASIDVAAALHRAGIVPSAVSTGRLSVCLKIGRGSAGSERVPCPWGCAAHDAQLSVTVDEALTAGRAAATRARILRALALQTPDEATACAMQLINGTLRSAMP